MATSPGAAVSHRAAAAIYGLDGFNGSSAPIEVSSTHKIRTRHGIVAHRVAKLPHCDLNRHEGLVVTSPTRTIIDLAGCVDEERLRIALDSALRQRLTSIAHLKRRLKELGTRGRRGAAAIGRLLRLYRCEAPSGSVLETKFENLCRRHHLDGFTRQYPVGQFRVDFAWPKSKVLVELDGFTYHANRSDHGRDLRRQNLLALKQPGWVLLRFNWFDVVAQPEAVVRTLRSALGRETGPEAGAGVEYQLQRRQS
jgi:very-short-patch-repair endonuclease